MYVFKEDRVIEFDGLLSANTLVEFLLDVSSSKSSSQNRCPVFLPPHPEDINLFAVLLLLFDCP